MDTRAKASELTTTGLLLAVSLVLCFVGVLFPTFGTYLKYLIPGMMAVIKTKYGYRYLTAFSLALLILVAVFFGIEQMVTGLFFVIPIGFALALVYEDNSIKNHLFAVVIFAVTGVLLLVVVGGVLGIHYREVYQEAVERFVSTFGRVYEALGLERTELADMLHRLMWLVITLFGVVMGYITYFMNKVVYRKGLDVLGRNAAFPS